MGQIFTRGSAAEVSIPERIPGMITPVEASYLRWLGAERWDGSGSVLEFGPWLGASTWCLARGMVDNPERSSGVRLVAFDDFVWRDFFSDRAGLGLRPGDSFESAFARNLAGYDFVRSRRCRLPDEDLRPVHFAARASASDGSVPVLDRQMLPDATSIVFVDSAKSWPGVVHLLRVAGPSTRPGALWAWQDFKLGGAYWIQLAVAWLLNHKPSCLELVDVVEMNTVTFRAAEPLDPALLRAMPDDLEEVGPSEGVGLLESAALLLREAGDDDGARLVALSEVGLLADLGATAEARRSYRRLERRWPFRQPRWPLLAVGEVLEKSMARPAPTSLKGRAATLYHAAARRSRR